VAEDLSRSQGARGFAAASPAIGNGWTGKDDPRDRNQSIRRNARKWVMAWVAA
jgi:hypothetical protein